MSFILVLAIVVSGSVQYEPATPNVGDLVTITFPDPGEGKLSLLPSEAFEVVEVTGGKAVVRSFRPGTIDVVAEILTPGQQTQRHSVEIEIRSVLAENDDLQPAPLVLPVKLPRNGRAWWMIGGAALAALVIWMVLFLVAGRAGDEVADDSEYAVDASSAFLERLNRIERIADEEERWRQLADSTRWLLPRIDPALGPELTTSEVLGALDNSRFGDDVVAIVDRILHGGDWAKFSPFGAPDSSSASVISRARALAGLTVEEESA